MKLIFQSLLLASGFGLVFLAEVSGLSDYYIQIVAGLIFFYFVFSIMRKKLFPGITNMSVSLDIIVLTITVLFLILLTGSLYSPIFFLLYFLGFGITFLFEPLTIITYALGVVAIFLPQVLKNDSIESYIRLGSIFLITPLAYFFGREYRRKDKVQKELAQTKDTEKKVSDEITQDVAELLSINRDPKQTQKLKKIQKEFEILKKD